MSSILYTDDLIYTKPFPVKVHMFLLTVTMISYALYLGYAFLYRDSSFISKTTLIISALGTSAFIINEINGEKRGLLLVQSFILLLCIVLIFNHKLFNTDPVKQVE